MLLLQVIQDHAIAFKTVMLSSMTRQSLAVAELPAHQTLSQPLRQPCFLRCQLLLHGQHVALVVGMRAAGLSLPGS